MTLHKKFLALLATVLIGSSLSASTTVSADVNLSDNNNNTDIISSNTKAKTQKWVYPFKRCDKKGVHPLSDAQVFGMTDYLRSFNPPSYFHDGWDFGHSEVGYSNVYAIHAGTVKKVTYGNGLGWFVWVVSPDKYVEIYQEGFNKKSDIKVKPGQKVKANQKIGHLTGTHLHLGLTKTSKKYINAHGYPCNNWNINNGTWMNPVKKIEKANKN